MSTVVTTRDTSVDSATGVLITLVVLGHVLATMHGGAAHAALFWLYTFHVPAFVFVSGYVTRYSRRWAPGTIASRLLFPYVVFLVVQRALTALLEHEPFELRPLSVPWTLWYLLALTVWRLTVPLVRKLNFSVGVLCATAVSIVAAGSPFIGPAYSLGRIFGLFPFFVAGLLWRDEWWRWVTAPVTRVVSALVLIGTALWAIPFHRIIPRGDFLFSQGYEDLELGQAEGVVHRTAVLVIAAVMALAVISLVWRKLPVLPSIGVASLTVYVLHAVVLMPWHLHGAPEWFAGAAAVVAAVVGSALLAWVLSRPFVVSLTRPLVDVTWWQRRVGAVRRGQRPTVP